jgi:predicted dehydrogenase
MALKLSERGDVQALKRHVEEGNLGRIYHAKATWMRRNGIPGMGGWFTSKELAGGGPLIDLGVHMVDMAIFLMGEPEVESVSCATYAELGPRGRGGRGDFGLMQSDKPYEVEDLATAFIRFSGGATLSLEAGWAAYRESSDDFGVTLYGTDGGAEMKVRNYGTSDTVRIYTDVAGVPAVVVPEIEPREGHYAVVRRFIETIWEGAWEGQYGEDGLNRAATPRPSKTARSPWRRSPARKPYEDRALRLRRLGGSRTREVRRRLRACPGGEGVRGGDLDHPRHLPR